MAVGKLLPKWRKPDKEMCVLRSAENTRLPQQMLWQEAGSHWGLQSREEWQCCNVLPLVKLYWSPGQKENSVILIRLDLTF